VHCRAHLANHDELISKVKKAEPSIFAAKPINYDLRHRGFLCGLC
jgi:hypothetical protein